MVWDTEISYSPVAAAESALYVLAVRAKEYLVAAVAGPAKTCCLELTFQREQPVGAGVATTLASTKESITDNLCVTLP